MKRLAIALLAIACWLGLHAGAAAQAPEASELLGLGAAAFGRIELPPGVRRLEDIAYGPEPRQRMDVYLPAEPSCAPILLMVHGGAWMVGNKASPQVVNQKLKHWVRDRGFIFVSIDYRLVPAVDPVTQAQDVALAMAKVQTMAASWGGDPQRLVLMGHSAGAHLVALLSANPALAARQGAQPWLGSVVLDSAALDTSGLMQRPHMRFYDRAFGSDPDAWRRASPTDQIGAASKPMLLVCSSRRMDHSCEQSEAFAHRIVEAGGSARVLPQDLTHMQVNAELGLPGNYTQAVDAFIASIDRRGCARPN